MIDYNIINLNTLYVLILSIFFHELGHYIFFKFYGYNTNLKFNWFGISVGSNIIYDVKIKEYIITLLFGINFGLIIIAIFSIIPIINFDAYRTFIIYIVISSADILNIMFNIGEFKYYNFTIKEKILNEIKEYENEKQLQKN